MVVSKFIIALLLNFSFLDFWEVTKKA